MAEVLHNKNFGHYATRDPLGSIGDCTTAPKIPQIFGELTGLQVLHSLQQREIEKHHCLMNLVKTKEP